MKTSQPILKNLSRPAAFIATKHIILNAKDATDLKQAQKAIDNYIYEICEKPLREERKLDLQYILSWKINQLHADGFDVPQATGMYENANNQRLSPK